MNPTTLAQVHAALSAHCAKGGSLSSPDDIREACRAAGIEAPEMYEPQHEKAEEHADDQQPEGDSE